MANFQELLKQNQTLRSEITQLKRELGDYIARKRELFAKLDLLRKGFRESIGKIKLLKSKRDEHTASVKQLKETRNAASATVKKLSTEIKNLRDQRENTFKKLGSTRLPSSIADEINRMEYRIETNVLPFGQEQKLMKIIKEKKAELKRSEQLTGVVQKLKDSSKQLSPARSTSEEAHQELQLHASVSQKLHEEMLVHSRKADELKKQMQPIDVELKELSQKFGAAKKILQEKIAQLDSIQSELSKIKTEEAAAKKQEIEKQIQEKEKELTEKMKSGKKLTNKDLLMFRDEEL